MAGHRLRTALAGEPLHLADMRPAGRQLQADDAAFFVPVPCPRTIQG